MSKKKIISNTLLFIAIIAFILVFSAVFGTANIFIGITTVTAMLMFLGRDLTIHPLGNTVRLILLNLLIGVAAFLAHLNVWLAIPVNFIAVFIVSYALIYNLRNPLYFPFLLQYIFIFTFPVSLSDMPLRLTSLVVGAVAIMALQMIVNKNKITKSSDKKLQAICTALNDKIDKIKTGESIQELDEQIRADISTVRNMVYDKRKKGFFLTEEGRIRLNLSASLEKINLLLNEAEGTSIQSNILDDLRNCLELTSRSISTNVPEDSWDSVADILSQYKGEEAYSPIVLSLLNNIDFLKDSMAELNTARGKSPHLVDELKQIPDNFRRRKLSDIPSHTKSLKLSYAIRMALGITISGFIIQFFDLGQGRWMMFTFLSVSIPIYEQSRQKMRDRVIATIIGVVLVTIFFSIFQTNAARSILLLVAGYLMFYVQTYRYSMIIVTFSAIGAADLMTSTTEFLTLDRLLLVAAGVVLAIALNKLVLPYTLKDANQDLESMYKDTIREMLKEVMEKVKQKGNPHGMKNLLMITNRVEDKIKHYNRESDNLPDMDWLNHQRLAVSTIYELYVWIEKRGIKEELYQVVLTHLQEILRRFEKGETLDKPLATMKEQTTTIPDIQNRMVLNMMITVAEELESSKADYESSATA